MLPSLPIFGALLFLWSFILLKNYPRFSSLSINISIKIRDIISWSLCYLSLICLVFIVCAFALKGFVKTSRHILFVSSLLILLAILTFSTKIFLSFYVYFELSLVPIFWLIIGGGYNLERLRARIYIFFYTFLGSLPLLILILFNKLHMYESFFIIEVAISSHSLKMFANLKIFFLILAFLIKIPIFLFHLWLPKAHVEAPVYGSMVLAAILLKLGAYGMIRLLFIALLFSRKVLIILKPFALVGGVIVAILCLSQTDIKVIIAYSSVRHMAIVITATLINTECTIYGRLLILLTHGIASSGLFASTGIFFKRTYTRNTMVIKSFLRVAPTFILLWFILCLRNMGGPPTINLVREIILQISIISQLFLYFILIGPLALFAIIYSIMIYSKPVYRMSKSNFFFSSPINLQEIYLLSLHAAPAILTIILARAVLIYIYFS